MIFLLRIKGGKEDERVPLLWVLVLRVLVTQSWQRSSTQTFFIVATIITGGIVMNNERDVYRKEIGGRIRIVGHAHNLMDQDMADILGLSVQQFRKIIVGMHEMGVDKLYCIIKELNPNMNFIFYGDTSKGLFFDKDPSDKDINIETVIEMIVSYIIQLPKAEKVEMYQKLMKASGIVFDSIVNEK